ncbi:MAG: dephospho-CoA kinase [Candidatus Omnitrophota bacterium]|nr:dephospho-CoA kinase [Candidatus Omnitrophota bacterium]
MPKQRENKKIIIGVTGSFGSGKSTVSGILAAYGARIIDADKIAANCLKAGSRIYQKVISAFGDKVIAKDGEIDRAGLAKIVFNDKKLLKKLNHIVHPEVIRMIKAKIDSIKKGVIILDAPLLLEAGLVKAVDKLIVVTIDPDTQIKRLLKKTRLKRADILKRIRSQISQNAKSRFANFIIDNSSSLRSTKKQVLQIRRKLWKS